MVRNNRGRKPSKVAGRTPSVARNGGSADGDPPGSPMSRSSLAVPAQQPAAPMHTGNSRLDQPNQSEAPPESWREFVWRLFKDKEAQAGCCRLVRTASLWVLCPLVVLIVGVDAIIYHAMPTTSPAAKLAVTFGITVIGALVTFLTRRWRRRLVIAWQSTCPDGREISAQDRDRRLGKPHRTGRQHRRHADPNSRTRCSRQALRSPSPCRSRSYTGLDPVTSQC
jgi:hypothetical protein